MDSHLSKEVLEGLRQAELKALRKKNRLRIWVDEKVYPVLNSWDGGFSLEAEDAPHLRGLIDLYDGSRHLCQCLIICSATEGDEVVYEYKRSTAAVDKAPIDFAREDNAPIALLT